MPTAYTPILQLALPVTGELQGTWGTVVNDNITSMIEQAIAGLATISTWTAASHTLTTANGTTDEARCAVLECSGAPGAAATVVCPALSKVYVIKNSVTGGYAVTLKTSAGTGISVPNGSTALLYCDGTNVVSGATYMATLSTTQVDILAQGDLRLQDTTGGEYVALQAPATIATSYTLTLPVDDGTAGQALITDGSGVLSWSTAASGDVYGPASATDNAIARFDGTTGKIIQNSVVTIADTTGNMAGVGTLSSGAITSSGQLTLTNASDYNLYASGVGDNFMQGALGIGTLPAASTITLVGGNLATGAATVNNILVNGSIQSDVTGTYTSYGSNPTTAATAFTLSNLRHFVALQQTLGAGSTVTNQFGFYAFSSLTGATNNYGFYGNIASGTNRYNFYAAGTAQNYFAGATGIGDLPSSNGQLRVAGAAPAVTDSWGIISQTSSQASSSHNAFYSLPTVSATSTLNSLTHYYASQSTFSNTVTNQRGFVAESNLTGATNNYGFYGNIASGTGRWNFYAAGTADNYFAGNVGVGGAPSTLLHVNNVSAKIRIGADASSQYTDISRDNATGFTIYNAAQTSFSAHIFQIAGTERARIATTGIISLGAAVGSESLRVTPVASAVNYVEILGGATGTGGRFFAAGSDASIALDYVSKGASGAHNFYTGATSAIQFRVTNTASAVNYLQVTGAITGGVPYLQSIGTDTNVDFGYWTKGTGVHRFWTGSIGNEQFRIAHAASAVNYIQVQGAATETPFFSSQGSSTNIDMGYVAKGAGFHTFYTGGTSYLVQFQVKNTTSAVNYLQVTGGTTGNAPTFSSQGSDTNIGLVLSAKGTGSQLFTTAGGTQFAVANTASAVNYVQATGAATGFGVTLSAQGSDTNIALELVSKGTSAVLVRTNGGFQFAISHTASAVNYLQATGAATGGSAQLSAQGSDANVSINYIAKGTGGHNFYTNSSVNVMSMGHTASAVNYALVFGSVTGSAISYGAAGTDTNIDLALTPKGTGVLAFGTHTAGIVAQAGYITIKDAGGTTRRLLVG